MEVGGANNFCTPMFLHAFFKISSQMIIIRSYAIRSAKPLRENCSFLFSKLINKIDLFFVNYSKSVMFRVEKILGRPLPRRKTRFFPEIFEVGLALQRPSPQVSSCV